MRRSQKQVAANAVDAIDVEALAATVDQDGLALQVVVVERLERSEIVRTGRRIQRDPPAPRRPNRKDL